MQEKNEIKSQFCLRPYQEEIVKLSLEAISSLVSCHSIIQLPTGCGKTVCFAELIRRTQLKTLLVAHREELLTQAKDKIAKSGIEPNSIDIILQSKPNPEALIWVASIQTLVRGNRLKQINPSLIIIDECHHAIASTYKKILDAFPNVPTLGFTATPTRRTAKEKQELATIWDKIIYQMSIKSAILQKYLASIVYYKVKTNIDLDNVPITMGDFNERELTRSIDVESRNQACVQKYQELGGGKAIIFCASIKHAENMQKTFKAKKIQALFVSGQTKTEERHDTLQAFQNAPMQENIVIVNVGVLTEGFDCPNIRMVILARPTTSPILYLQMLGRGTRTAQGKDKVIVIDIVDNCQKRELQNALKTVFNLRRGCQIEGDIVDILKQKYDQINKKNTEDKEEKLEQAITQENIEIQLANILFDMPEELEASSLAWYSPWEKNYFVNLAPGLQLKIVDEMLTYSFYCLKKDAPAECIEKTTNLDKIILDAECMAQKYSETWYCWKKIDSVNKKVSDKQKNFLKKIAPDIDSDKISRALASQIISASIAKKQEKRNEPITPKQIYFLRKYGVTNIPKTKGEAMRLIGALKNEQ